MTSVADNLESVELSATQPLPKSLLESTSPRLLKGFVKHWPGVDAGQRSAAAMVDYLRRFDQEKPLTVYEAPPEAKGRIFYNDDLTGFNFAPARRTLSDVLTRLLEFLNHASPPTFYVGSTLVDHWLPGFRAENDLDFGQRERLTSIWLGNRTRIAAHFDVPNNIACAVAGRRRFTLFPPEQTANLYIGPLDFTPSGQPISMVDTSAPDIERFPRYKDAQAASRVFDLEPGDALFIPSMWWHHVESLDALGVLVNFWWRSTPVYQGSPMNALHHALLSLRDLPAEQRIAWRSLFDHYVFEPNADHHAHLPQQALGPLSGIDEATATALKKELIRRLT